MRLWKIGNTDLLEGNLVHGLLNIKCFQLRLSKSIYIFTQKYKQTSKKNVYCSNIWESKNLKTNDHQQGNG